MELVILLGLCAFTGLVLYVTGGGLAGRRS